MPTENFEKYIKKRSQGEELGLFARMGKHFPRDEYKEGRLKLDFTYKFQHGEVLRATEDEEGFARVVLERNGKKVFDFNELLPDGYRFATPSYLKTNNSDRIRNSLSGGHFKDPKNKLLFIGDMRTPDDIFAVLHEVGHANQKSLDLKKMPHETVGEVIERRKKEIAAISFRERDAWSSALKIARAIKNKTAVDLFEPYENFSALKQVIYGALLTHRFDDEYLEAQVGQFSEDDMKIFENLFDKGKFGKEKKEEVI